MKYSISGEIILKGSKRKFSKETEADSQKRALDAVYMHFGSNYGLSRKNVKIVSVQEVK